MGIGFLEGHFDGQPISISVHSELEIYCGHNGVSQS